MDLFLVLVLPLQFQKGIAGSYLGVWGRMRFRQAFARLRCFYPLVLKMFPSWQSCYLHSSVSPGVIMVDFKWMNYMACEFSLKSGSKPRKRTKETDLLTTCTVLFPVKENIH